jgi:hypothetical protein
MWLEFELRALNLQNKHCTTWTTLLVPMLLFDHTYYSRLSKWDYFFIFNIVIFMVKRDFKYFLACIILKVKLNVGITELLIVVTQLISCRAKEIQPAAPNLLWSGSLMV